MGDWSDPSFVAKLLAAGRTPWRPEAAKSPRRGALAAALAGLPPPPRSSSSSRPASVSIGDCQTFTTAALSRPVTVNAGRVLPWIHDLAVGEGREIRAAFLYNDLHGFSKTVATSGVETSFSLLQVFVELMSRITSHYAGSVVDCAGDRILAVFSRAAKDMSAAPIHEAVTAGLWMQTVMERVIAPAFQTVGLPRLSATIGIDYGLVTAGCVGLRNNKRFVFFGDAANNASKLQESGAGGETVLAPFVYKYRPTYLQQANGWWPVFDRDPSGRDRIRVQQRFDDSSVSPPPAG